MLQAMKSFLLFLKADNFLARHHTNSVHSCFWCDACVPFLTSPALCIAHRSSHALVSTIASFPGLPRFLFFSLHSQ